MFQSNKNGTTLAKQTLRKKNTNADASNIFTKNKLPIKLIIIIVHLQQQ